MWEDLVLIIGAYLFGSIPHLDILGKMRNIELEGDSHISLWRRGGRAIGLVGIFIEFIKGITPILIGKALGLSIETITAAGLAVVIGQMWPVFSHFNGGKGNSIGAAVAAVLAFKPWLVAIIAFAIGAGIKVIPGLFHEKQTLNEWTKFKGPQSNSLPLGMGAGFLLLPIASLSFSEPPAVTIGFAILFILIILRRTTSGLSTDLKKKINIGSIIINRLLYDRSFK